ncbi:hypothetical protein IEU95_15845 [Hoyosella rhizosphaerae]|uniref:Uncharacterized protein n=1 Tax=Hoyosella rhizosphaerae TaxID=1755582 RepID=A0A916UIT8_9ACTN|nr:hypothetical protein [Hoyosella rhizosphaerae]MBN4928308.1 hypothetical protein [Hoyosella rhizosphaerae]GGC73969.1 hypothetical protein GCM10011410_28950 [Hoyosella rhizosphaerae]
MFLDDLYETGTPVYARNYNYHNQNPFLDARDTAQQMELLEGNLVVRSVDSAWGANDVRYFVQTKSGAIRETERNTITRQGFRVGPSQIGSDDGGYLLHWDGDDSLFAPQLRRRLVRETPKGIAVRFLWNLGDSVSNLTQGAPVFIQSTNRYNGIVGSGSLVDGRVFVTQGSDMGLVDVQIEHFVPLVARLPISKMPPAPWHAPRGPVSAITFDEHINLSRTWLNHLSNHGRSEIVSRLY